MHLALCLCADLGEPLTLRTRVVVIRHLREGRKPTNTGRLVPLTLTRSEVRTRGAAGAQVETADLPGPGRRALLLYPSADARPLTPEDGEAPVTLIVPDGTWRQARKVHARVPGLAAVPRVCLPPGPPSRYRLRSHRDPRFLATFEAVARALGILEGPPVQRALERVFDLMVERTLWSRGQLGGGRPTAGGLLTPRPAAQPGAEPAT